MTQSKGTSSKTRSFKGGGREKDPEVAMRSKKEDTCCPSIGIPGV